MAGERFQTLADERMTADQKRVAKALMESPRRGIRGPFPALLRRPDLADATRLLGDGIRYNSSLSDRVRELAILIVVRHWNVHVEWESHSRIAREAGFDEAALASIAAGRRPAGLTREEAAAHDVSKELLERGELGDATYEKALEVFDETGLVDLISTIAYYAYISTIMNAVVRPAATRSPT